MVPIIPQQRQHKSNASKRFDGLINYLQGEQEVLRDALEASPLSVYGGRAAQPSEFSDLLDYATAPVDTKVKGEKCVAIRTHGVSCIETASAEMNAVSRKNARVLDPVYHFILSWPEHEKPAYSAIFDAAEHAITALGFEAHQYVVAIHANTDNVHAHIAVNRVHPTTFKSRHIEWAKRTLHFAARESEIKHGWSHDNGIFVVQVDGHGKKQIVLNTKHAEASKEQGGHAHPELERDEAQPTWHDPESLGAWLKTSVAKTLKEELPDLTSWQALHVWLEQFGISLEDTGGGGLRLRAVSPDTGEILEVPASKGLRILKRSELEKRWGDFRAPFTNPVTVPDFSNINRSQIEKGIARVNGILAKLPFGRIPPPDHVPGLDGGAVDFVPEGGGGLHELPSRGMAVGDDERSLLLSGAAQGGLGDGQAGQDSGVRSSVSAGEGGRGGRVGEGLRGAADDVMRDPVTGRRARDPEQRAQRRAERAAQRLDLRRRFVQYRSFVAGGDTEHFARLKVLREERSRELREIRDEVRSAKGGVSKDLDREIRLVSLVAIDNEATRRRLAVNARFEQRADGLRVARVPPLVWREWLYEQANRGDKAALSALRGIVYQAKRDAKLPAAVEEEIDDLSISAADQREAQYKRLMARLLEEERKEAAIRSASVHAMRPHEADALVLAYAGIQWRVTGNGNVAYSRNDGQHLFTDRGNRLTFDRMRVTDEEIRLALVHAREKFGRELTLTGEEPVFVERMARLADDMGIGVLNPELQLVVRANREARAVAASKAASRDFVQNFAQEQGARADESAPRSDVEQNDVVPRNSMSKDAHGVGTPSEMLPLPLPIESTPPESAEERLRGLVLAIDPRAKFELAATGDSSRSYIGPIAAALGGEVPMFAQHVGRGNYAVHHQEAPTVEASDVVEVRYTGGAATIEVSQAGRGGVSR